MKVKRLPVIGRPQCKTSGTGWRAIQLAGSAVEAYLPFHFYSLTKLNVFIVNLELTM